MKTILGTLLALGLLSTAASAQWCPPGQGYGQRTSYGQTLHRPMHAQMPHVVVQSPEAGVVGRPIEPAPLPQQPAPEDAPPK